MKKHLLTDIEELVDSGIITSETAGRIKSYYEGKNEDHSRFNIIISVLATIFASLGIILILNHNWDVFTKTTKAFISYIPLLIAFSISYYTLKYRSNNSIWNETAGTSVFFSIGISIALISQVFHLYTNLIGFIQVWLILAIPILFILNTKSVVILIFLLSNFYTFLDGSFLFGFDKPYEYFFITLLLTMFKYHKSKQHSDFHYEVIFAWLLAVLLPINIITFVDDMSSNYVILIVNFMSLYILISKNVLNKISESSKYAFTFIGNIALHTNLIVFANTNLIENFNVTPGNKGYTVALFIFTINFIVLIYNLLKGKKFEINQVAFIIYTLLFIFMRNEAALFSSIVHVLVIMIGVEFIQKGSKINSLRRINYGLLLICIIILKLFFDIDLSITVRGVLFLVIGFLFFLANRFLIKRLRKYNESK